jgi:hypothetical protein
VLGSYPKQEQTPGGYQGSSKRVHNCGSHGITELVSDILIAVPKKLKNSNNRRYSRWFCTGYFMKTIGSLRFLKITGMDGSLILVILPKTAIGGSLVLKYYRLWNC